MASPVADETLDGLEHFEAYGLTSRPKPGAEVAALFVDGDRTHGIVLVAADRRFRLQGLEGGEVALYDDQGQSITIGRGGIVIDCAGMPLAIVNCPSFKVIDDTFRVLVEDGEIDRQYKRWFLRTLPTGQSLDLPMSARLEAFIHTMASKGRGAAFTAAATSDADARACRNWRPRRTDAQRSIRSAG